MTALVSLFVHLRRAARAVAPLLAALALGGVVLLDASTPLPWPWMAAAGAALALLLVQRAVRRHGQPGHRRGLAPLLLARRTRLAATVLDVEIGLLAVVGAFGAVLHIDGGLDGSAYAAVYVCLALASAFSAPLASLVVASLAMGLEVGVRTVAAPGDVSPTSLLPHFGFMSVFTVQSVLLLRGEIARVRQAYESRLTAEIERLRDDARSYRLLGAPQGEAASPQKSGDDERLARSGVEEIHQSVHFALRLLHDSLGLHTAMLLWQNDAGTHLRVSELCSSAQNLCDGPFLANEGIFGAALTHRTGVRISGLKPSYKLPYYAGPCPVRCAHALPVFEHGALRGVLVVDRVEDRPLSAHEQELVEDACRYAVRAIQNERVFVQLERAKAEQGKLYRAAEALGGATTEGEVVDAGVRSAREVTAVDFAAVTLFDDQNRVHEIRAVDAGGRRHQGHQRPAQ
ncbi:MAG: GAF domain-containing protein, partial [Polyangiaceae bacterium]